MSKAPRAVFLAAPALLLAGCFGGVRDPLDGQAEVVLAAAPSVELAKRAAVASFFDLFVSTAYAAGSAAAIDREILAHADRFIAKYEVKEASEAAKASGNAVAVKALVNFPKLGWEMAKLGVTRPPDAWSRAAVSIRSEGPGDGTAAAAGMARVLSRRGFEVRDLDDELLDRHPKGDRAKALKAARAAGAEWLLVGTSRSERVVDERLQRYPTMRAVLKAEAVNAATGEGALLEQDASAVDATEDGAATKALENAAELLAEKWRTGGSVGREREEVAAVVFGPKTLPEIRRLIESMRSLPGVVAAAFEARRGYETRVRLYVHGGADLLAAHMGKKPHDLKVTLIEPHYMELETRLGSEGD